MTETERRDYARGYSAIGKGGEVSDRTAAAAAALVEAAERPFVFSEDQLERDGWKRDELRRVWTVPAREVVEEEAPVRTGAAEPDPPRHGGGGSAGGGDLAALRLDELDQLVEQVVAYERWHQDPAQRCRRWDRRALYLGRALRAKRA